MKTLNHKADFCVIGGGMAGLSAAVAAARHGAKVVLIQDRPVLGGNASSEIRMTVSGARGDNMMETGILEEIRLENLYRNYSGNYQVWDSVLYGIVKGEINIELLLNCTCTEAEMDGNRIKSVKGWQMTAETWHIVEAGLFADCSGDSILAPLTGAEYRIGREASSEFNETIAPETADRKTMGMSCLIQTRETPGPQPFVPPAWANSYPDDEAFPYKNKFDFKKSNFWWIELGGEQDSIHDTEQLRDELLKIVFGIWDHIKNHGDHGAENYVLEWVGFLPGKRESRRYVGDHILTQNDVSAEGRFDDLAAYGGWPMDVHFPEGFYYRKGETTIFHKAPSPYGIPYRSMYSKNIENLFFAGRNISATHAAMSSTRVMATCAVIGQAVGTAAAIAVRYGLDPRGVYREKVRELQEMLMEDDSYLPWHNRKVPDITMNALLTASDGDPEPLRNGIDRPVGSDMNGWIYRIDAAPWVMYDFGKARHIREIRIISDSDLNRQSYKLPRCYPLEGPVYVVPPVVLKRFRIEAKSSEDAEWNVISRMDNNYQRLIRVKADSTARFIRLVPEGTWGADEARLFAFEVR